jgi:integrase
MKQDALKGATVVKRNGISVRIRPTKKNGSNYFVADCRIKGRRKLIWRSTLADARVAANEAIDKIANGEADALELKSSDRHVYLRARAAIVGIKKELDDICREYAEANTLLAGRASIMETVRDWLRRHKTDLPKISIAEAAERLNEQAKKDRKSKERQRQLVGALGALAKAFNAQVDRITSAEISSYLTALPVAERTKRNHRDVIGFFNRWLVMRGYLPKGTDWLESVQNYSGRKLSEIEIYTAQEVTRLLLAAGDMMPFIAIGAFAGLRHAEIARLDWREIDLEDSFIEVRAAKSKTGDRRLVPIHDNLKKWLLPYCQTAGKVIPYANTAKQLLKIASATHQAATETKLEIAALKWKHNALRHSFISYRVAECADIPRVADEAGNSPQMIRQHYLRRVKPAAATEWFAIMPRAADNVIPLPETSGATPAHRMRL